MMVLILSECSRMVFERLLSERKNDDDVLGFGLIPGRPVVVLFSSLIYNRWAESF